MSEHRTIDGDGMCNLRGRFDPELAVKMAATIDTGVATLFAEEAPEFCPVDAVEKNKFLAAHALAWVMSAQASPSRTGRPEFVVVIDADAPGTAGPVAEWAIPVELPASVVVELAGAADVVGVVVRNGCRRPCSRRARSRPHDQTGQSSATSGVARAVSTLRHSGLLRPVRPLQTAPCHLVAQRRPDQSRQSASRVFATSQQDPQRPLDHRTRPRSGTQLAVA